MCSSSARAGARSYIPDGLRYGPHPAASRPPSPARAGEGFWRLILLALIALPVGSAALTPALAHPPTQLSSEAEKATAEEVVDFRKQLADAIARKDAAALRRMYAEAFTHVHGSGKLDGRDARIVAALAGDPVIENAPASELVIRIPGGWTAIATGVSPIRSLADGKTYAFRWTAVYVRTDASWQLAASQATRMQEVK